MTRTRFSVASEQGKENLAIMAEAITAMKKLDATNPLSWDYQAALHGTNNPVLAGARFVNSCPHFPEVQAGGDTSKFFLVWHRLFCIILKRSSELSAVGKTSPFLIGM